jgi:hypothetical protein
MSLICVLISVRRLHVFLSVEGGWTLLPSMDGLNFSINTPSQEGAKVGS